MVSRFDNEGDVHWLDQIDAGSLKIKVASTIVAIFSIHLLQIFLNVRSTRTSKFSGTRSCT
ncbi:MAG: YqhA family protein [Devosia sp.]